MQPDHGPIKPANDSGNLSTHIAMEHIESNINNHIPECGETVFENVVITDVDGNETSNQLRAAAMRHIKQKGHSYIAIPYDPKPVNEFFNPKLFPMIYPTLYPYGLGGFEDPKREVAVSLKRHA